MKPCTLFRDARVDIEAGLASAPQGRDVTFDAILQHVLRVMQARREYRGGQPPQDRSASGRAATACK